ncbi:hypothetical protein COT72_02545 [archaeon CG10_big_fil_rev_8_21_14_0_10_43_11]|nr:MAG: hypothetical protein COT72_02545 [archaeon CG10_big_fil_rev_8_21_14_0_10_43_11]
MVYLAKSLAFKLATGITGLQARTSASTTSGVMGYVTQNWIALLIFLIAGLALGFGFRFIKWGV